MDKFVPNHTFKEFAIGEYTTGPKKRGEPVLEITGMHSGKVKYDAVKVGKSFIYYHGQTISTAGLGLRREVGFLL